MNYKLKRKIKLINIFEVPTNHSTAEWLWNTCLTVQPQFKDDVLGMMGCYVLGNRYERMRLCTIYTPPYPTPVVTNQKVCCHIWLQVYHPTSESLSEWYPSHTCVPIHPNTLTYPPHSLPTLPHTHKHIYTWPGIQSEDTIYTRVYSVFVPAFKARTNLCITHSKWGHFFTHLWTCLARTKRGLRPYPPCTHIMAEGGQCT